MFKAKLDDNTIIKSAFNSITNIVDEVQIQVDQEGMRLNALDKAHISFIHLELGKTIFTEYECTTPISINIDTQEFNKVLSRCKTSDELILTCDEDNLIIIFQSLNTTRTFKIKLIDMEYEPPSIPSVPHTFTCELQTKTFKENISDVELFSEKLKIKHAADDDFLYILGDGGFGETNARYLIETDMNGDCDSVYSIDKIKDFLKSEKFSNTIILKSGVNIPLILEFQLVTGDGLLNFLLAPRLEEEE